MANDATRFMASEVARLSRTNKRRKRRAPRQQSPTAIEAEYVKVVDRTLSPAIAAFAIPIFRALPELAREGDATMAKRVVDKAYLAMASALPVSSIEMNAARFARRTAEFSERQVGRQVRAALGVDVAIPDRGNRRKITRNFITENVHYFEDVIETLSSQVGRVLLRKLPRVDANDRYDFIQKTSDGYVVISNNGHKLGGPYKTRVEAEERLAEVEKQKHFDAERFDAFQIRRLPEGFNSDELAQLIEEAHAANDATRTIAEAIEDRFDVAGARAERIARDQIGTYHSQVTQAAHRDLGVTSFIWRTMNDERVRDSHAAVEGEQFSYDDLPTIDGERVAPGEPVMCRCYAEPVFSDIIDLAQP
jgi:SPP1 gp7 family putative phage head morphogenesis protein